MRCSTVISAAMAVLVLIQMGLAVSLAAGCAVKPPMRYVAPDGSLHAAHEVPSRRTLPPPTASVETAADEPDPATVAPSVEPAVDPVRAHFTTALGLHAGGHWGEALATYRGVIEADPDGPFAGRALVRMAEIHLEPGNHAADPERARVLLREVVARFPGSTAAGTAEELLGGE
jgi:hypothetical protein